MVNFKNSFQSEEIKEEGKAILKKTSRELKDSFYFIWDIGKTLFFVVAIAFLIRFYLVQPFYVEGQSMEPSFDNGEYLLIDELTYHFRGPERGDVIVFHPPLQQNTYQNYIKRIIGLPGETIDLQNTRVVISNKNNTVGKVVDEKYLCTNQEIACDVPTNPIEVKFPYPIDNNNYFVMGDNRTQSSDSRVFGEVFQKNITGRVWFYIKTEPWFRIPKTNIVIPKIKSMGRIAKPIYKIDG